MGLVVKLIVGVHDSAQVDAANLLRAALVLHVVEQSVNDATHSSFIFQIVDIFWRRSGKESDELLQMIQLHTMISYLKLKYSK